MRSRYVCLIVALAVAGACSRASGDTFYQVGNSLTWDSQPLSTEEVSQASSTPLDIGYHIRSASSLNDLWSNPTSLSIDPVEPYGGYSTALPGFDWDGLALQPHPVGGATLQEDFDRFVDFVDLAQSEGRNAETNLYLYAAWPQRYSWGQWDSTLDELPADETATVYSEAYFDRLMGELGQEYGDQVQLIPAGHVLSEVVELIDNDSLPGVTHVYYLYRDTTHLNSVGRFIASTTVLATVTGESPVGMPIASEWSGSSVIQENAETLQKLIWEVVTRNPLTGVVGRPSGDFDGDNDVDLDDYQVWREGASQALLRADQNFDATVDDADLAYLLSFFDTSSSEELILIGDYNLDGEPNEQDYLLWRSEFGVVGDSPADGNGDGVVDVADYTVWRDVAAGYSQFLNADYSGDGRVDADDFAVWAEEEGTVYDLSADANDDGYVNLADFTIWRDFYTLHNPTAVAAIVTPEPAGGALLAGGLLLAAGRRRAR